jgi:hypothetical protein
MVLIALSSPLPGAPVQTTGAAGERPFRSWHFAEGVNGSQFQTYFSLFNLADQPASVVAHYHRDDGIRLTQWFGIPAATRLSFSVDQIVGPHAFGASFYSDQDVAVERSTGWGPEQHAETTLGFAPESKRSWYFAEGTTRGLINTYFITQNLSDQPANVTATFTRDDGSRVKRAFTVGPRARDSYRMKDLIPNNAFASSFVADQDIVVERTLISEGPVGVLGGPGYSPTGSEVGFRTWTFAEGSTRGPYLTNFVLFNSNSTAAQVRFRFSIERGTTRGHTLELPAQTRLAFDPRDVVPSADFATTITSDQPIIAERSYYSTGDGLFGTLGYTQPGARQDSRAWYFAEVNTNGQIETFFLIFNLSDREARIRASYFTNDGKPQEQSLSVPAGGRLGLRANDVISGRTFAARFLADQNVLVERTFYFPGWSGFTAVGAGVARD